MRLRGVVPPVVTPFTAEGAVDEAAFTSNLERLGAGGVAGVLVLGSNGEAASLDEGERLALVRRARQVVRGRPLLVGTGLESTRGTLAFTRQVAELGADAALVLTPHYYRSQMTEEALLRHYEAVAEASPIPVLIYSVPAFTGIPFPLRLAERLAAHPRVEGIKESSGDVPLLARIVATTPESFWVACGNAPAFYPALCVGAQAGILAIACCAPRPILALHAAFAAGDHARALRLQRALTPLATAVTSTWGVAGLKLAMDLAGYRGGHVRAPLLPPPPQAREELTRMLREAEGAVES